MFQLFVIFETIFGIIEKMNILIFILQTAGSLAFILYGLNTMSNGIQKSLGGFLQKTLNSISRNKVHSLMTGLGFSLLIQSSAATASMGVNFVNAGLLTLEQTVPLIFGANIGTTVTAWVVAGFGFYFNVLAFALPLFALGFFFTSFKKLKKENIGEALLGFSLLFIGIVWLKSNLSENVLLNDLCNNLCNHGALSVFYGVVIGFIITVLINSSSGSIAVILVLAFNKLVTWDFSVSYVIGIEMGSSINVIFNSRKSRLNGKRVAFIHVLFNFGIGFIAIVLFRPLSYFFDAVLPGLKEDFITLHIAALHSLLKIMGSIIFFPFSSILVNLSKKIYPAKETSVQKKYNIEIPKSGSRGNASGFIVQLEKEISDLSKLCVGMYETTRECLFESKKNFLTEIFPKHSDLENYIDQMKEQLTLFIVATGRFPITQNQEKELSKMLAIINDLEDMSDDCFTIDLLLKRAIEKKIDMEIEDIEILKPYTEMVSQFIAFIDKRLGDKLSLDEWNWAEEIENKIDDQKEALKKVARKRLENGSDVKSELLYIDIVRQIEKVGDRAHAIASVLK